MKNIALRRIALLLCVLLTLLSFTSCATALALSPDFKQAEAEESTAETVAESQPVAESEDEPVVEEEPEEPKVYTTSELIEDARNKWENVVTKKDGGPWYYPVNDHPSNWGLTYYGYHNGTVLGMMYPVLRNNTFPDDTRFFVYLMYCGTSPYMEWGKESFAYMNSLGIDVWYPVDPHDEELMEKLGVGFGLWCSAFVTRDEMKKLAEFGGFVYAFVECRYDWEFHWVKYSDEM